MTFPVPRALCLLSALACLVLGLGTARAADKPIVAHIPSQRPSGIAVNDQIWFTYYPAVGAAGLAPQVVLLHPIGAETGDISDKYMQRLAARIAARGMGCAVMVLPYHQERQPPDMNAISRFIEPQTYDVAQALLQSASDVGTLADWLAKQPGADPHKLGVLGVSLGAIVAHLAMGLCPQLTAGVAVNGGGDLKTLYRDSFELVQHGHYKALTPAELATLPPADPVTYAGNNQPRHVLMINSARDVDVPPANARILWNALGKPPIIWTDTNHFAFLFASDSLARTATAYMNRVWNGNANDPAPLPKPFIPTLKLGYIFEFDGNSTPDVQYQFYSFAARPDHKSALHLDLGESGRGPFLALGTTLNAYVDAGVLAQIHGHPVVPYVALHLVF